MDRREPEKVRNLLLVQTHDFSHKYYYYIGRRPPVGLAWNAEFHAYFHDGLLLKLCPAERKTV